MESVVVAIIGGCGFLGQHILRELLKTSHRTRTNSYREDDMSFFKNDNDSEDEFLLETFDFSEEDDEMAEISEIRIIDIKPFEPFIDLPETHIVKLRFCDIRIENQLAKELEDVDVVIHCAAKIPSLTNEEIEDETMMEVNLEGTENVISACKKANVKVLIYTSTLLVVVGGQTIDSHTENFTPEVSEESLILGNYAKFRRRAEQTVLDAHNSHTKNGKPLLTMVLRPTGLYGEGDDKFIPYFIRLARNNSGQLPTIGPRTSYHQLSYVGNAAYAHICAVKHLLQKERHPLRDCAGMVIYINDDTPAGSTSEILSPFLEQFNCRATNSSVPFFLIYFIVSLMWLWAYCCEQIGRRSYLNETLPPLKLLKLVQKPVIVSRMRAEQSLRYRPVYNWRNSKDNSLKYYRKVFEKRY